ncbi:MAG: protein-disulfide reductase DsbD [bacterium]
MINKIIVCMIPVMLFAQSENIMRVNSKVQPAELTPGEKGQLIVECIVSSGYHLSGHSSGMFEVIPGQVKDVRFGDAEYPQGEEDPYTGSIYHGTIKVRIEVSISKNASAGKREIPVTVNYQACSEDGSVCYPPAERQSGAELIIVTDNESVTSAESGSSQSIADRLADALENASVFAFIIVFMGGLLSSLTPCVYPMIPITLAVIGAQAGERKLKGFILSLFYVLGIAVTFSILGILAARTGMIFGSISTHPAVLVIISLIFLIMGLSLVGLFVLQIPSSLASKLQSKKGKGFLGAFLTGLVAGLVISPCISPILVVILAWVAKSGSLIMGASLLFTYAFGLGVLFILIGTFSGIIKALPKSGGWMEIIERTLGLILIILAIVFIRPILSVWMYYILWSIFLIFTGTYIGGVTKLSADSSSREKFFKSSGLLLIIAGVIFLFFGLSRLTNHSLPSHTQVIGNSYQQNSVWISDDEKGFSIALRENKPLIVDFYAEWCAACKELDEKTWSDPQVKKRLSEFVPVKLDITKRNNQSKKFREKYNIYGMPTVIFFNSSGKEVTRFEGFKSPQEVLEIINKI